MKRIKGFDGLRAIAVTGVFIQHLRPIDIPLSTICVYIFFVLSGFLISGILSDQRGEVERNGTNAWSEIWIFYYRRSLRIFPIYYVTLAGYVIWIYVETGQLPPGLMSLILYLSNIWMATQSECDKYLCHFWSLAIEEQFYIFLAPLLIFLALKTHVRILMMVFLVGSLSLFVAPFFGLDGRRQYLLSTTNFAMLAAGGVMSLLCRRNTGWKISPIVSVLSIFLIFSFLFISPLVRNYSWSLYLLYFWFLIISIAGFVVSIVHYQDGVLVKILEYKPLVYVGVISYGFYLMHPATIHVYRALVNWPPELVGLITKNGVAALNAILIYLFTFGVSHISWTHFEKRILQFRDRPNNIVNLKTDVVQ